jgi:hypothetical protein
MGQIVIDIPNRANRRYNVENAADARQLLRVLDELKGVERNQVKLTRQQMQDIRDGIRADRIVREMQRTGESYSLEQIREL